MSKDGTLNAPNKPKVVPNNAQWLSGQGAGVWFSIQVTDKTKQYIIQRYSSEGKLDCKRLFICEQDGFDISQPYQFVHISHCAKCRIEQNNKIYVFNWVGG